MIVAHNAHNHCWLQKMYSKTFYRLHLFGSQSTVSRMYFHLFYVREISTRIPNTFTIDISTFIF